MDMFAGMQLVIDMAWAILALGVLVALPTGVAWLKAWIQEAHTLIEERLDMLVDQASIRLVRWAEQTMTEAGGTDKLDAVLERLEALFPGVSLERLREYVEKAVYEMNQDKVDPVYVAGIREEYIQQDRDDDGPAIYLN